MSLRDYFAIHANEEDIQEIMKEYRTNRPEYPTGYKITRQEARYMYADEMMKVREKYDT